MNAHVYMYTGVGINIRPTQNGVESRSFLQSCTKINKSLQSKNQTFSKRLGQFKIKSKFRVTMLNVCGRCWHKKRIVRN